MRDGLVGEAALRDPLPEPVGEIRAVHRVPVGQVQPLLPDRRVHVSRRYDVERRPLVLPLQVEIAVPLDVVDSQPIGAKPAQALDDRLLEGEGEPGVAEP